MKKIILLLGIALFTLSFQATAQNCNQGVKLAEKTWEKWGPWKPNIQIVPFKAEVQKIKRVWNWIAANGGATIGPRLLEMDGGNETGNIAGQTKSTFVTPPSFNNNVKLTINKYDGKAKTGVTICVQGRDGITTQKASYEFPNDKNGKTKVFNLKNVKGKIIIVAMKNKSVGNKFKYRINAK
ncbi:hypothetical protein [Ulvibacter litoralis]|uniref:Uncharacterized protein n=1 Tax=Ulvibacter litoralis TaxID=227084 RepID=A0A1G7BX72_9FLAO|nr:hypothetical protein [Ulvibacter litoralis]GHC49633.1 hypothetical protein GCM10008083_11490 [Ulvibacter litoralis]SDE30996.1 hypothetical protein SAMN05421855_10137 [Ulvibacter litoralis]